MHVDSYLMDGTRRHKQQQQTPEATARFTQRLRVVPSLGLACGKTARYTQNPSPDNQKHSALRRAQTPRHSS